MELIKWQLGNYSKAGFGNAPQKQVKSPGLIPFPTLLPHTRIMLFLHTRSPHPSSHMSKIERINPRSEILGLLASVSFAEHCGAFVT